MTTESKFAGRVTEQNIAGGTFLRVDVPEMDGQAGFTRYYGAGAIYSITPVDEALAHRAAEAMRPRPVTVYGLILPERQLPAEVEGDWEDKEELRYDEEDWRHIDRM